jgi:hypothetical protein
MTIEPQSFIETAIFEPHRAAVQVSFKTTIKKTRIPHLAALPKPTSEPAPPKSRKDLRITFADPVVTAAFRPLTNAEEWTLYFFEKHATKCTHCHNPYKVYKANKTLCQAGYELCADVADLPFHISKDGVIFSRRPYESHEVRVEIPAGYVQVMGLFKAIQRSGLGFLKYKSDAPGGEMEFYKSEAIRKREEPWSHLRATERKTPPGNGNVHGKLRLITSGPSMGKDDKPIVAKVSRTSLDLNNQPSRRSKLIGVF